MSAENDSDNVDNEQVTDSSHIQVPDMGVKDVSHETTDIHTDDDYGTDPESMENDDDDDLDDDEMNHELPGAGHQRSGSLSEKRESIKREKSAMEKKLRTLSQKLDQELNTAMDEFSEMDQINEDKTVFGELFDKIDPDQNGDVDENEWVNGLKRMHLHLSESDMHKIFKLMDNDKSGYIDRQDWITFCMAHYNSEELRRLHDSVLLNIKGHSRKPSNMLNMNDAEKWSVSAINSLEKQMTKAFLVQGSEAVQAQEEEEEYFIDMERQAEVNPDWAKPERALDWTPKEVAFWLDSIELSQYARKFDEEMLDGSILLNDCDKELLQRDMGIKPLHVGKILREVDKLRKVNADKLQESYKDWNELIAENKQLRDMFEDAGKMAQDLQTENAELKLKVMSGGDMSSTAIAAGAHTFGTDDYKSDDAQALHAQIEDLYDQKILFAQRTSEEIYKLTRIIKALCKGSETPSKTPGFRFNPVDSFVRSLGYQPTAH